MQDFQLFKAWIHAIVDRKIADAFMQDNLREAELELELEAELINLVGKRNDNPKSKD